MLTLEVDGLCRRDLGLVIAPQPLGFFSSTPFDELCEARLQELFALQGGSELARPGFKLCLCLCSALLGIRELSEEAGVVRCQTPPLGSLQSRPITFANSPHQVTVGSSQHVQALGLPLHELLSDALDCHKLLRRVHPRVRASAIAAARTAATVTVEGGR